MSTLLDPSAPLGALLTFPAVERTPTDILVRCGVSFISTEQACANAEAEIPDFDIIDVANAARAEWNELLGRVGVETAPWQEDLSVLFYSSVSPADQRHSRFAELTSGELYRTHLTPADCEYLSCPSGVGSDAAKTLVKIPFGPPLNRIMTHSTATYASFCKLVRIILSGTFNSGTPIALFTRFTPYMTRSGSR